MSREIRVRAWDEANRQMIYPALDFPSWKILQRFDTTMLSIEIYIKGDKELFMGDVVKITCDEDHKYMNQDKFEIKSISDWCYLENNRDIFTLALIGNIHENPELLKQV